MTTDDRIDWTDDDRNIDTANLLEAANAARNICTRRDTTGEQTCRQGYDHTEPCDWMASPDVTGALARIRPDSIDRAQAAYNAALLADVVAGDE